jgi:phosphoglycerate dehydrogenase-like enzyme
MTRPVILVTSIYQPGHLSGLRAEFPGVAFHQLSPEAAVPPGGEQAEALLRCYMSKPQLRHVLEAAPGIRWIHTCTAGYDQLLVPEIADRGLIVTRSAATQNIPMAEFVVAYILVAAKRFPHLLRAQARREWSPPDPDELGGSTVGIIGAGAVGAEVARRCAALGMRVIGTKRTPTPLPHFDQILPPDGLPRLLAEADFVVLATPLTAETRHMIGEAQLRLMKPTAHLLNVARGALIVEADLVRALRERWIAGACLDAFEQEPLPPSSPLWDLDNVVITPHCSYRSPHGMTRGLAEFKENLRRYLAGEPLLNLLRDPALGY